MGSNFSYSRSILLAAIWTYPQGLLLIVSSCFLIWHVHVQYHIHSHTIDVAVVDASVPGIYIDKIPYTRIKRRNDKSYGFIDMKPNRWRVDVEMHWANPRSLN